MSINVHKCISSICLRLLVYVKEYTAHTEMLMPTFLSNIFGSSRKFQVMMSFRYIAAFSLSYDARNKNITTICNIHTAFTQMKYTFILALEIHKR